MARSHSLRPHHPSRHGRYAALWLAYLLGCGAIVFAGAMLSVTALRISSPDSPIGPPQKLEIPVTRIQLFPDRNDLCRTLLFHNDSGRYQEGGTGKCTIPSDMLTWTFRGRAEAIAEAFRASWKGDSSASRRAE
jgi:hypothetical protein